MTPELPLPPMPPLRVTLVGMPGSGKSTVGRQLARHLDLPFVDTDAEFERQVSMSVREFFDTHGEAAFRDQESAVIDALTQETGALVMATGGGAVIRAENRERLRATSHVFYLRSSPEELHRRLRHDTHRPLLQVADPLRRLRDLYRDRDPLYRQAAHFVVETPRPSVSGLVHMVLMQLELAGWLDPSQVPSPVDRPSPSRGNSAEGEPKNPR